MQLRYSKECLVCDTKAAVHYTLLIFLKMYKAQRRECLASASAEAREQQLARDVAPTHQKCLAFI